MLFYREIRLFYLKIYQGTSEFFHVLEFGIHSRTFWSHIVFHEIYEGICRISWKTSVWFLILVDFVIFLEFKSRSGAEFVEVTQKKTRKIVLSWLWFIRYLMNFQWPQNWEIGLQQSSLVSSSKVESEKLYMKITMQYF